MASGDKDGVRFLDWLVEIVEGSGFVSKKTSEITTLPTGTQFSVSGTVDRPGYIYVVLVGEHQVAVLHPTDRPDHEKAGTTLRLPADKPRFTAPIDGAVYVVDSRHVISNDEWPKLFPGRDPPPDTNREPT